MRIIRYLTGHKLAVLAVFLLLVVQAFCDLSLPRYTASIVDNIVQVSAVDAARSGDAGVGRQMQALLGLGLQMLGLVAVSMATSILVGLLASRTGAAVGRDLRSRLFAKVISFSQAEVDSFSAASLITRGTNDVQLVQTVLIMLQRMVLYAPILAVGGIVMVAHTNLSMGWVIVVGIGAVLAVCLVLMGVTMPKFKIMQKLIDRLNLVSREILTGLPVIRAFGREGHEEARFEEANHRLMATQLFTNRVMSFMMPAMMLTMNLIAALIVWVGAGYVEAGTIQTGDLIAFITYSMVIIMSFLIIGMVAIMLPRANVAAERIDEVLGCEPGIKDPQAPQDGQLGEGAGACIAFEHVDFRYSPEAACALSDVTFTAPAGKTTALIGATGSGKSTVVKLIERFYDVSAGAVTIDGVDVRELSQDALRAQLGYVPQEAFLFSGTIGSNVTYADGQMPAERVTLALEVAQAAAFVGEREQGLQTPVAQGGTNVSGGQRQRLAIARALAADARAYLFDDSFSALDYQTDARLRADLATRLAGKTVIIVAQRIATIMNADLIVVLDEGRVVGQGTHAQLLEECAEYRAIALSQLSAEELAGGAA